MKASSILKYFSLAIILVLSACSMEKRVYNTGYHINWNKNINTQNLAHNNLSKEKLNTIESKSTEIVVDKQNVYTPTASKNNSSFANTESKKTKISKTVSFNNPIKKIAEKKSAKSNAYSAKGEESNTADEEIPFWVLILLCFVLSPLAVGFATNWETTPLIINVLLYIFTCGLGGLIHGLIVVLNSGKKP